MTTTNKTTRDAALADAIKNCDAARAAFTAAKPCTKAWREASDDLDFWTGKVAMLSCLRGWG